MFRFIQSRSPSLPFNGKAPISFVQSPRSGATLGQSLRSGATLGQSLRSGATLGQTPSFPVVRGQPPPPELEATTVSLFSQPFLDTYNQCYKNIVVVNLKPQGPLGDLVRLVKFPVLSPFKQNAPCNPLKQCGYALTSIVGGGCCSKSNGCDLMTVDEVPTLISFLVSNGYTIDTSITKMFNTSDIAFDTNTGNKLICFVSYHGA